MAIIDYSLILIFFLGVIGFVFVLARTPSQSDEAQAVPPAPPASQKAKESYAVLAAVFIFFIALTFLSQKRQTHSNPAAPL